jgi:hypothetical protein
MASQESKEEDISEEDETCEGKYIKANLGECELAILKEIET